MFTIPPRQQLPFTWRLAIRTWRTARTIGAHLLLLIIVIIIIILIKAHPCNIKHTERKRERDIKIEQSKRLFFTRDEKKGEEEIFILLHANDFLILPRDIVWDAQRARDRSIVDAREEKCARVREICGMRSSTATVSFEVFSREKCQKCDWISNSCLKWTRRRGRWWKERRRRLGLRRWRRYKLQRFHRYFIWKSRGRISRCGRANAGAGQDRKKKTRPEQNKTRRSGYETLSCENLRNPKHSKLGQIALKKRILTVDIKLIKMLAIF